MNQIEILYGKGQGKGPPSGATNAQLENFIRWKSGELASGKIDERYRASTERQVKAAEDELQARREGKSTEPEPKAVAALAKVAPATLGQAIHDPAVMTTKLQELSAQVHLVSPATSIDVLPEGMGVAISYVAVSTDESVKEVYNVGGALALSGPTLKKIAAAAGLDWDPEKSGRLDNGRDPHYCHYKAVGYVRNFDGSMRTLTGEVEIDAREGSPLIDEIRVKAKAREESKDYKGKRDGGASQILELRKFLLRHAETKAKLRAIADMGIKRAYTKGELDKPFAVARLTWTGQSSDPELRKRFAEMNAELMLGGVAALYGNKGRSGSGSSGAPAAALPPFIGHDAPPIGAIGGDFDFDTTGGDDVPY